MIKKFLFLFLFLLPFLVHAQKPGRIWTRCGIPTNLPSSFDTTKDYMRDSCAKIFYYYKLKTWKPTEFAQPGVDGVDGADGAPGMNGATPIFQTGSVTTLASNTPATGLVRSLGSNNYAIDLGVPQGIQGVPGQNGTGGATAGYISPDSYGAVHQNRTFSQDGKNQAYIDANYAGLGLTVSDQIDLAALLKALSVSHKKGVVLYGDYYVNKSWKRQKFQDVMIYGNWARINTVNATTYDVFTCDPPASLSEANAMEGYSVTVKQLIFNIQGGQTAVRPYACFMLNMEQVYAYGGNTGFKLEFCLQPILVQCRAQSCVNGFMITYGGFSGSDGNNSQTNYAILDNCRTHTVSGTAIDILSCYGAKINTFICEGNGTINRVINYDTQGSTTTKDLYVNMLHFEQIGGANECLVKVNTRDSKVYIYDIIAHYKGLLVDATSSTGLGLVHMDKINYAVGDVNGKLYKSNNISWFFELCETTPYVNSVTASFTGTAPGYCSNPPGCGYNKFGIIQIPR